MAEPQDKLKRLAAAVHDFQLEENRTFADELTHYADSAKTLAGDYSRVMRKETRIFTEDDRTNAANRIKLYRKGHAVAGALQHLAQTGEMRPGDRDILLEGYRLTVRIRDLARVNTPEPAEFVDLMLEMGGERGEELMHNVKTQAREGQDESLSLTGVVHQYGRLLRELKITPSSPGKTP